MSEFVTKDSGLREDFATGARRDVQDGKPRYELLPVDALKRLAELYARGAEKYGEHNWERGIPFMRVMASLLRHAFQYLEGDRVEDHMAAVAWNAFAIMTYEERIKRGQLPPELDDRGVTVLDDIDLLRMAYRMAQKSPDTSTQNGAVLVGANSGIIGLGCNSFPQGVTTSDERWKRPLKYSYVEHAERKVIYQAARAGHPTHGATLYVAWYACADCARAIIEAGVKEVVGHDHPLHASRDDWAASVALGRHMLNEAGVKQRLIKAELGEEFLFNGELVKA
jgi:dCMP deaminase